MRPAQDPKLEDHDESISDNTPLNESNELNEEIVDDMNDAFELKWYKNPQNYIRFVIVLVLTSFIIFALCHPTFSIDLLTFFLSWIENNPWDGSIAFVLAYIISNILMIPGLILSLGAGIIYSQVIGFWSGIFYATFILTISCFLGSSVAFLNGRYLLRNVVVYFVNKNTKFQLIDEAVKKHGFKVVFLFRLSPVTPYSIFNYLMGFSGVNFSDYCLGAVGMIPNVFAYVYLGASIRNIYEISTVNPENSKLLMIITVFGIIVIIFAIIYFAYMARNELRRIAKQLRQQRMNDLTSDIENTPLTLDDEYNSNDDLL